MRTMQKGLAYKIHRAKRLSKFAAGSVGALIVSFLSLPTLLIEEKENTILDKISFAGNAPEVHASDQFSCGSSCSSTWVGPLAAPNFGWVKLEDISGSLSGIGNLGGCSIGGGGCASACSGGGCGK